MTELEDDILTTLLDLDRKVAAMKLDEPKPDLRPVFQRLDELAALLPAGADGQLLHFLRNQSYEKARLWLQGRQSEIGRGACGR